jgi:hypothetical protein
VTIVTAFLSPTTPLFPRKQPVLGSSTTVILPIAGLCGAYCGEAKMCDERSFKTNTLSFEQAIQSCSYAPLVKWVLDFGTTGPSPPSTLRKVLFAAVTMTPLAMLFGYAAFTN